MCTEFKEIRKEWKARKKAEEAERKQRDEAAREAGQAEVQTNHDAAQQASVPSYTSPQSHRLPPLPSYQGGYTQTTGVTLGSEYSNNYITSAGFPSSPYAQSHQQVYGQREHPILDPSRISVDRN